MFLALLLACGAEVADTDETDETDDTEVTDGEDPCGALGADDPCCREPSPALWSCTQEMWGAESFTGAFSRNPEPSDATTQKWFFQTPDGSTYDIWFHADLDLVPDLAALGEVTVIPDGGCGSDGEGASGGTFSVLGRSGELLFAVGATNTAQVGSIQVTHGAAEDEACPERTEPDSCWEAVRNHAVVFSDGTSSVSLLQGESATLGGAAIYLRMAMLPVGEGHCDDVSGRRANWVVVSAP